MSYLPARYQPLERLGYAIDAEGVVHPWRGKERGCPLPPCEPPDERQVEHCVRVLSVVVPTDRRVSECVSYTLKHVIEELVSEYISNGAAIEACRRMGIPQYYYSGPNTVVGILPSSYRALRDLRDAVRCNETVLVVLPSGAEQEMTASDVLGWLLEHRLCLHKSRRPRRYRGGLSFTCAGPLRLYTSAQR